MINVILLYPEQAVKDHQEAIQQSLLNRHAYELLQAQESGLLQQIQSLFQARVALVSQPKAATCCGETCCAA